MAASAFGLQLDARIARFGASPLQPPVVPLRLDGRFKLPVPELRKWMNMSGTNSVCLSTDEVSCVSRVFVILGRQHAAHFSSLSTHCSAAACTDMSLIRHEFSWKNKLHEDALLCAASFKRMPMQHSSVSRAPQTAREMAALLFCLCVISSCFIPCCTAGQRRLSLGA